MREIPGVFHNEPPLSPEDQGEIHIFDIDQSRVEWECYVSRENRHFMLLHDQEWPSKIVKKPVWYTWQDDWNNDDVEPFNSLLSSLDINPESQLLIFWMKELSLKTKWSIFCGNWVNFLYEDEGCILVAPDHDTAVVLSNGKCWRGRREKVKAT